MSEPQPQAQGINPIEFSDFSGGETDYFLLGSKARYEKARNYLIDADKRLILRPGSQGFDFKLNHVLPDAPTRVNGFLYFSNENELLVQQAQNIFYLQDSWKPILGPEGSPAIGYAGDFDALTSAEWQGHTFFANASGGRPGKIYRDLNGDFQVRTLGLPFPESQPVWNTQALLLQALALANDIRSSMVSHMNNTTLHDVVDKWSLAYFAAQVWVFPTDSEYPGPLPAPTPAPAATDQASLFLLIAAMNSAYEHHGMDVDTGKLFYHTDIKVRLSNADTQPAKGPFQLLKDPTAPTSLLEAVDQLNELRMKWNWHRLGLFSHVATNDYDSMNLYPISVAPIANVYLDKVPYIESNYSEVYRYANYLKKLYNNHISAIPVHSQPDNSEQPSLCTIPDATDLETAFLIAYWVWAHYGFVHFHDANITLHTNTTMDTTAHSASVTDVGSGAVVMPVGDWVITPFDLFEGLDPTNLHAAKVLASAAGTATLSKTASVLDNDQQIQFSSSMYHGSYANGGNFQDNTVAVLVTVDETPNPALGSGLFKTQLDAVPSTLAGWVQFMSVTFNMLVAHTANDKIHYAAHQASDYLDGLGPFYKPQIASYGYSFVNKYDYATQNGVQFLEESEPIFVGPFETAKQFPVGTEVATGFSVDQLALLRIKSSHVETMASCFVRNIPRLRNTTLTNYDVAHTEVEIFRTQDGGNTFYLLDSVPNGTTDYEDVVSDQTGTIKEPALSDRQTLYTTGGEVSHTQAPEARFLHILNNTSYFGYIRDTGQTFKNRVIQSVPGAPYTGPADFFIDLDDEVVGISSVRTNVIVLCKHNLYRLTGGFNNLGQGNLAYEKIGDRIGCISSKSIVQTELGIFFAGPDGFYFTDAFQLIKISIDRNLTYARNTKTEEQASLIYGTYDRLTRRIWWSMQSDATAVDVDESHIYHVDYGVKPSGVYTSASNGTYWSPTAMVFFNGEMIRGDRRGLLFRHNSRWNSDPKIPEGASYDDFLAIDQWGTAYIPYLYRSCAMDFGSMATGSYLTKIKLMGRNSGNSASQIVGIADNNNYAPSRKTLATMLYQPNPRWGDARVVWGASSFNWKYDGKLDLIRRFPSGNLRAQTKQIEISPAFCGIYNYDNYPSESFVNLDLATLKVTIDTPSGYTKIVFPQDVVGMYIAFADDEYVNQYEITEWAEEELTIADPNGALFENLVGEQWVIRGFMSDGNLSPLGYVLHVASFGQRASPYPGPTGAGENG